MTIFIASDSQVILNLYSSFIYLLNLFKYDTMVMGSHPTTLTSEAL